MLQVKLNLEKERVAHEKTRKKLTHLPDDGEKSRGKNLLSAPPPKQVPLAPDAKPVRCEALLLLEPPPTPRALTISCHHARSDRMQADMASFFANMQHSTRKSGTTAPT
jgi:hypothetical protein